MLSSTFVHVRIGAWHAEIEHRLDALSVRVGQPVCTIAVQENSTVPRNVVFLGFDPNQFGQVIAYCHPLDREATDTRVQEIGGKLVAIEPLRAVNDT